MKRFLEKYTLILLIIPFLAVLSGCSMSINLGALGGGDDIDTSFLDDSGDSAQKAPSENTAAPPLPGAVDDTADKKKDEPKEDDGAIALSNKSATLDIDSEGRTTPFVPYRERNLSYSSMSFGDLPYPPQLGEGLDSLDDLVSAKVTGILFEPNSPSAIINVMDDDYLVKPGDQIEGFKISSITKDYVAIQTGSNVYRAKVGDIVEGEMYGSGIYNLGNKFAGHRRPANKDDILIVATKKQASKQNEKKSNTGFGEMSLPPVPEVVPKSGLNIPKINLKTQAGEIPLPLGAPPAPGQSSGN